MPSFPPPGSVTICEINRDLIIDENLSDERAKETDGKVLGMVFSPVSFQSDHLLPLTEQVAEESNDFAKQIFYPNDLPVLPEFTTQGVSWHPHKHCLAFISGPSHATVRYYDVSDNKEACVLATESQRDVEAIEWRPNSGKMLAVACNGGVCIWSSTYLGNAPPVKFGITSPVSSLNRSGVRWILVDFLRSIDGEQIRAVCWDPYGRYLASASRSSSSFTVWDVSQVQG